MPQALGAQKAFPQRQIIALCGDGGLAMLLGDLLTTIQEKLPIKIVVFNNSSLNFVELEQKVEGLLDHYTDLLNPDFGKLASVIGLHGQTVTHGDGLEQAVENFLKHDTRLTGCTYQSDGIGDATRSKFESGLFNLSLCH